MSKAVGVDPLLVFCSLSKHTELTMAMITSLADLPDSQKAEMVASLATLLAGYGEGDVDADKLVAIATASGNTLDSGLATIFATVAAKAPGGITEAYMPSPGGGGGGGGGGGYVPKIVS